MALFKKDVKAILKNLAKNIYYSTPLKRNLDTLLFKGSMKRNRENPLELKSGKIQDPPHNPTYYLNKSELYLHGKNSFEASVVIINRNGRSMLEELFNSLINHHEHARFELIIVDHHSSDGSLEYILSKANQLYIKLLRFEDNNSFSYANNIAAKHSDSEKIIFCNNDIIFIENVLDSICSKLNCSNAGCVGVKLHFPIRSALGVERGEIQHNGIQFEYDSNFEFYRPFNVTSENVCLNNDGNVDAVTGALLGIRKEDFIAVDKFDEGYNYGYEDIDLCLKVKAYLKKDNIILNNCCALHDESKTQKKDKSKELQTRRRTNISLFKHKWTDLVKDLYLRGKYIGSLGKDFKVGIIVSEDSHKTAFGDYFTGLELAKELRNLGYLVKLVPIKHASATHDPYNAKDLDIIINLLHNFNIKRLHSCKPNLIKICWARNWFDRWLACDGFEDYDIRLASSNKSCEYLESHTGNIVNLLRIGSNIVDFNNLDNALLASDNYQSDYCFTGSYWKAKRDIEQLNPNKLPYKFKLFGSGWEKHANLKKYAFGHVNYSEMPKVYASTKILIDDANHLTKEWGSINSRVFDGLASGVLVISNSKQASIDGFDGMLPYYENIDQLYDLIEYYISHDNERRELTAKLKKIVDERYTYKNNARKMDNIISDYILNPSLLSLKIPVPSIAQNLEWGDFHFAYSLAKSLRRAGCKVRIDSLSHWYYKRPIEEMYTLNLKGISEYLPDKNKTNLIWLISHPEKCNLMNLSLYSHIFVASEQFQNELSSCLGNSKVSTLLQCTDVTRFNCNKDEKLQAVDGKVLFVGNSRNIARPIVMDAIKAGIDVHVYGTNWEKFIPSKYIKGQSIENNKLCKYYKSASVILNDHWDSMKRKGFVSNRLFDCLASGCCVISDKNKGINDIFKDNILQYNGQAEDLKEKIQLAAEQKDSVELTKRRKWSALNAAKEHSFDARAVTILSFLDSVK